ncbi:MULTISPECIES: Hsp20/alpha crystallin family protein [Priestia]|uniref:Hsp20/alpha crystallin family protein n=1 Tax=Priestia TaxID=2800373 RepID=UPI0007021DB7|nr:Hsp20/alpha crystallin family protein [Priestia megaterium]KQU11630.1 spore coat protein [Bacillus sp. Leaf75]USL22212.1 Hsp20/alpha crystallin family protein [Priestia megaterium]
MDFDKLMQWMEFAKKYQTNDFWNGVFDQTAFNEFMKENMDMNAPDSYQAPQASKSNFPPVDIYVTPHEIIIIADLPGYLKENLQVSVSGSRLLLKGSPHPLITGQLVVQERPSGDFNRIIELPEPTDAHHLRAKFENGLLILSYHRQFFQEERIHIE